MPSRHQQINAVWLELALIAADLLALTQSMLLTDQPDLARAEPKTLRYRLLHTAARITRGQRKVFLRLAEHWPWALALAKAFTRLRLMAPGLTRPAHPAARRTSTAKITETPDPAPAPHPANPQARPGYRPDKINCTLKKGLLKSRG